MASVHQLGERKRDELQSRLKRIEGQTRGIQRMIEDGRDCLEIIDQMSAAKAAMNALSADMIEAFAIYCLKNPDQFPSADGAVEEAIKAIVRSGR